MKKKAEEFEYTDKFLEEAIAEFNELEILEEIEELYLAAQCPDPDVTTKELEKKDGKL